jgi:hypothetical protein
VKTKAQLLAQCPSAYEKGKSGNAWWRIGYVVHQMLRDLITTIWAYLESSRVDSGLVVGDPTTPSSITVLRVNISAGIVRAARLFAQYAAAADTVLIGAGKWAGGTYTLTGGNAVIPTLDGKTYNMALVAVRATSGVVLTAVAGLQAANGAEAAVTKAQVCAALSAALLATPGGPLAGLDTSSLVVFGRVKVKRVAIDTIELVHTNTLSDSALLNERMGGSEWV